MACASNMWATMSKVVFQNENTILDDVSCVAIISVFRIASPFVLDALALDVPQKR